MLQRNGGSTTVPLLAREIATCGTTPGLRIHADDLQRGITVHVDEGGRTLFHGVARHTSVLNTALCKGLTFGPSNISPSTSVLNVDGLSFFLDPV